MREVLLIGEERVANVPDVTDAGSSAAWEGTWVEGDVCFLDC